MKEIVSAIIGGLVVAFVGWAFVLGGMKKSDLSHIQDGLKRMEAEIKTRQNALRKIHLRRSTPRP
uniref:Uncharacterized protein n=1 Tax=Candidatus Kentrum sp. LFY TaxID=2126342 RepID=A0A450V147_9GAMM|nr:MAG: hypothetical protein BECKLFY1418A_GA0070994_108416 [Candidatus Kentron sp. LFY]